MLGVPRNLIEHSLNVDPKAIPKRQHLCRFADDRRDAIKKELAKLLAAGFIREVFHPEWLANPVLVCKKNLNEWRMCIDYTNLNKHCPKDPFGLPRIDQVIDSTAGYDLLCFLDCYSGYHQIVIKEEDQEKTELISMDSKKLAAPPSSNQQGTLRVSDATMIATSRNALSTLVISTSAASRTQKDYTSSARHGKVPSQFQR
jgi:hypothetical protein